MTGEGPSARPVEMDASMSRAELVEAWRQRRRDRRPSEDTGADRTAGPDGFALRRWRRAGVFGDEAVRRVERLLGDLLSAGDEGEAPPPATAVETVRRCLDGSPDPQLPAAVRAVLEVLPPARTAEVMTVVHDAGLPWLSPQGRRRLEHLMGSRPAERGEPPSPGEDVSGAFTVHHALRVGDPDALTPAVRARALPWLPLGAVDDLIDMGAVTAGTEPWQARSAQDERQYLLARLAPERADPGAAASLGWDDAVHRQRFLAGEDDDWPEGTRYDLLQRAAEGDTGVLKDLESFLPRPLVLRLRRIQDGAMTGNWDADMLADRGLWRLMAALWDPRAAVNPARGPFHALVALRYAYDCLSADETRHARAQLEKLVAYEDGEREQHDEAVNMTAYLALLDGDLDTALVTLTGVAGRHPAAEANLNLVRRRRGTPRNDRPDPTNPYLELRLPHGSPYWRQRYRDLRRDSADDRDESARINRAMQRIQQAERDEDWSHIFVLPLEPEVFALPSAPPVTLVPPVEPMPRRTAPGDPAVLTAVRDRALADLLPTLLNAPRRPDHQHRTTA